MCACIAAKTCTVQLCHKSWRTCTDEQEWNAFFYRILGLGTCTYVCVCFFFQGWKTNHNNIIDWRRCDCWQNCSNTQFRYAAMQSPNLFLFTIRVAAELAKFSTYLHGNIVRGFWNHSYRKITYPRFSLGSGWHFS